MLKYSIVIATYNRAADLRETLTSLAGLQPDGPWEVIVVDNNSPDDTRAVVQAAAASFPVPLRYLFEREQGRSPALNCGIRAAAGAIIVTTDDDVRVPADWLNRAAEGLRASGLRLRRRPRAADLGRSAPGVAARPRRQALGGHRAARLRSGSDRVRDARTARRQHGVQAERVRARGAVRPAHRADGRDAPRPGGPRMVHPRAGSRPARLLRPGDEPSAHHPGRPAEQALFPPLVLLARHQPGAALRTFGTRHGSARADARWISRTCRTSSACRATCIARPRRHSAAGSPTRCGAAISAPSSTSSGSASSPGSSVSASAIHGRQAPARWRWRGGHEFPVSSYQLASCWSQLPELATGNWNWKLETENSYFTSNVVITGR